MAKVLDIREETEEVTEIQYCNNQNLNICKYSGDIYLPNARLSNKETAENLIKALQKAIELGWVK